VKRTDAFARDFCRRMEEKPFKGYKWNCGGGDPNPLGKGHESVDIWAKSERRGQKLVLVEVELRRGNPVSNVAKIWKKADKLAPFVLVQIFSQFYAKGKGVSQRENAEFVGHEMERATSNPYLPVCFKYAPRRLGKKGGGRRRKHAYELADRIRGRLKSMKLV